MEPNYITVPFWKDLSTEKDWLPGDEQGRRFGAVRWHFVVKDRQLDGPPRFGERLAGLDAPPGSGAKFTYKRSVEQLDLETTIEKTARDNEVLQSLSASIHASAAASPIGRISSDISEQLRETLRTSFSDSLELTTSTKVKHELTTEVAYDLGGATQPLAHVRKFHRHRAVLYLAFIDYLVVEYTRQLGIRKKRRKAPPPGQNREKINLPVAGFEYWREYNGISWINEADHVNEVPEPYEIDIVDATLERRGYVKFPDVHSLHRIANAAFPLKWVKRKGPWSEEDLLAIEEREYVEGDEISWRWRRDK